MSFGWLFLLMSLAAYRIARFIVDDQFPPMKWLREKFTGPYAAPLDSPERQSPGCRTGWLTCLPVRGA